MRHSGINHGGACRCRSRAWRTRANSVDQCARLLRSWLDSWSGIAHVAVGMAGQGYDLQLTRYDEKGWRATFYTTGMEHLPMSATGTGWERNPRRATQRAAWKGLRQHGLLAGAALFVRCRRGRQVSLDG